MDERIKKIASNIVNYSINVKKDEKVLIVTQTLDAKSLIKVLIKEIVKKDGIAFIKIEDHEFNALLLENTNDKRIEIIKKQTKEMVDMFDSFIYIKSSYNDYEYKNVSSEIYKKMGNATKKIDYIRVNERKWILLNYPSINDANKSKMTVDEFYNKALDLLSYDYQNMKDKALKLKALMEKTDKVKIISPNTNLVFSIKEIPSVICVGDMNIPDGEVYTAPIKDSINGNITFNTKTFYQGKSFDSISLTFKNGKIIDASCKEGVIDDLNNILNSDLGSRYIGEFAIGFNPKILHPMGDILYDEKIMGSIHLTPGKAYKDANNGNDSSIHWDLVLIQRIDYGGGEIYFDDKLIRKDGLFIIDELKGLN